MGDDNQSLREERDRLQAQVDQRQASIDTQRPSGESPPSQEPVPVAADSGRDDPLWTVEQVAARLQVSTQTVRRLLRAGTLRGSIIGHGWRVRASDVERFTTEQGRESR